MVPQSISLRLLENLIRGIFRNQECSIRLDRHSNRIVLFDLLPLCPFLGECYHKGGAPRELNPSNLHLYHQIIIEN